MKDSIRHLIQHALTRLTAEGVLPEGLSPAIQVENTKDRRNGDFATNIAMMLAKPIVVAQDTNMDIAITENECGIVVPYANVQALEKALLRLANEPDLCLTLGQNGRKAYETKYGWPIMKTRLLNLYQNLSR